MVLINCSYLACCYGLSVCLMSVSVLFICCCCGQHLLLVGHLLCYDLCNRRSDLIECYCEGGFNRVSDCLRLRIVLRFIIWVVVVIFLALISFGATILEVVASGDAVFVGDLRASSEAPLGRVLLVLVLLLQ